MVALFIRLVPTIPGMIVLARIPNGLSSRFRPKLQRSKPAGGPGCALPRSSQ